MGPYTRLMGDRIIEINVPPPSLGFLFVSPDAPYFFFAWSMGGGCQLAAFSQPVAFWPPDAGAPSPTSPGFVKTGPVPFKHKLSASFLFLHCMHIPPMGRRTAANNPSPIGGKPPAVV